MPPIHDTYGKARVRVMRVARGERDDVREPSAQIMPEGASAAASTRADTAAAVATDTVANPAHIVVRENPPAEAHGLTLARRVLDLRSRVHPRVERAAVTSHETHRPRPAPGGKPHPHAVLLDGDGEEYARPVVDRRGRPPRRQCAASWRRSAWTPTTACSWPPTSRTGKSGAGSDGGGMDLNGVDQAMASVEQQHAEGLVGQVSEAQAQPVAYDLG